MAIETGHRARDHQLRMSDRDAIQKMIRLLDRMAHSVYCNDPKERRRLGIGPCPLCAWKKLKGKLRGTGFFQRQDPEYAWKIAKDIRGAALEARYTRDLNERLRANTGHPDQGRC